MKNVTYTLITDGSSDKTLMPIINWALDQASGIRYHAQYAELTLKHSAGLLRRVESAIKIYECDILFVHRDAETMDLDLRLNEIKRQLDSLGMAWVPVVPIRMTEAWLLVDEQAIRSAANNPNGKVKLKIPHLNTLENLPDPKQVLFEALRNASELPARRLANFRPEACRHRVAELIDDFSPLRKLSAFQKFEAALQEGIKSL
jgi:hypothetical protein